MLWGKRRKKEKLFPNGSSEKKIDRICKTDLPLFTVTLSSFSFIEYTYMTANSVSSYWSSIKTHLDDSAGKNMPDNVRHINTDKMSKLVTSFSAVIQVSSRSL